MGIKEYIKHKYILQQTAFIIEPSGYSYYIIGGKKILPENYEKKYPLPIYNKENGDTIKNWGIINDLG